MGVVINDAGARLIARLDADALRHNLELAASLVGPAVQINACVKANAYGHGLIPVAGLLVKNGVSSFAVGDEHEALLLREQFPEISILLFPPVPSYAVPRLVAAGITIGIEGASDISGLPLDSFPVYLKVDAGLGRLGITLEHAVTEIQRIQAETPARVIGVFTHLPFSNQDGAVWAGEQMNEFCKMIEKAERAIGRTLQSEVLASSALKYRIPLSKTTGVCPGQFLLGIDSEYGNVSGSSSVAELRPVLKAVETAVTMEKRFSRGQRFGVGGGQRAQMNTRVAILPVGYATSTLAAVERQEVAIRRTRCSVLSVSLEHTVVDVSHLDWSSDGETVTLLAADESAGPTLREVAQMQRRTPLEILARLTGHAKVRLTGADFDHLPGKDTEAHPQRQLANWET